MKPVIYVTLAMITLVSAQSQPGSSFESASNLPVQVIGANDLINVSVYDAPELSRTVRVGPDGQVHLPMLTKTIKAEGLMPRDLEVTIADTLRSEKIVPNPYVTVTVAEYHSRPISVAGAVKQPLTFQAIGTVSLLEAITRAGGFSADAGPEVLITRTVSGPNGTASALTQRITGEALIHAADPEANVKLYGGEEIRVPEVGKIFIVGNVKRPGIYPIQEGAEASVLKALAVSEGLLPFAGKQAYIYRREGASGGKSEIPIELSKIMARKNPDVPLLPSDILYVPDRQGRRAGIAAIEKIIMFGTGAGTALIYTGVR
jgi:polysaccharide export outer membrane protein